MICFKGEIFVQLHKIVLSCLLLLVAGCSADDPTRSNTFVPLTSIEVTGTYASMADKTINQYKAIGDFSGAFTRDITTEVSWRIENKKIASVSNAIGSEGQVTALLPGETSVIAVYDEFTGSAPVIVTSAFLTGIEITPQDAELQVGLTQQYAATGTFSDSSLQDISNLATWESSDTDVATIDNAGLATTHATGTSTISGTWQDIEAGTPLLVTGATLTSITITPDETIIAQGTTVQFEAEGTFSDDSTLDISDIVDWRSSDTGLGVINAEGLATGVASGEVEISASYDVDDETISATAVLTITNAVIESISITPDDSRIVEGESQQYIATGTFSDDSQQDITDLATWLTTDNSVGTISNSPNSRGLFVSIATGTTVVEATFGGISGETPLTVTR